MRLNGIRKRFHLWLLIVCVALLIGGCKKNTPTDTSTESNYEQSQPDGIEFPDVEL